MTHALFKQIDLTAKLGQDGSSLQAMNALRVIRETVAKHLADTEGAGEIPLERALLALRTIAEFPCPEQDDLSAANMRQIALAALGGAGASSEPGNPGAEPVSGPGNAGGRTSPSTTQGSGYSSLAESLNTLERWLDRVAIEDGYVGVPVIEAVEVAVNELRRLRQLERICGGLPQDAIDGGWTVQGIRGYAKRLEDQLKAALAQVEALRAELQSQRERNTELIFKLGSATNGWGRCEKERDAALARVAEFEALAQHSVPEGWMLVECGIWTQEQVDEMQKTVTRFRNSEFVDDRALAMAVADAGQCKAPEISLAELLAAAPVCRLSRSALTDAQMRRLYENSTETENERLGFEAFARLIRRAEAVHQITAAPGKEGV